MGNMSWDNVARIHAELYDRIVKNTIPQQLPKSKPYGRLIALVISKVESKSSNSFRGIFLMFVV